jgi:23S rRNA (cytidine1920-2'-O)/16S rRNA (cytidine1409-2'-O)-methyltransferase
MISRESHLEVLDKDQPYVSRGGVKLQYALEYFNIDPRGFDAMDIGSSTGGFTDCLIKSGTEKVFAVDVGYGQLAWELRQDPRVVLLERTNIRHLEFERLGQFVDLVVIDASFISLHLIFPKAVEFLKSGASLLALVKPQFEAGAGSLTFPRFPTSPAPASNWGLTNASKEAPLFRNSTALGKIK